jgi:hypothetical protein
MKTLEELGFQEEDSYFSLSVTEIIYQKGSYNLILRKEEKKIGVLIYYSILDTQQATTMSYEVFNAVQNKIKQLGWSL